MANAIDTLLILLDEASTKKVVGRTLLQKQAYFANEKARLGLTFEAHFYGPFSRQVSEAVDTLVAAGLVNETVEEFPQLRLSMWESRRYTYQLSRKGQELTSSVRKRLGKAVPRIRNVVRNIENAGMTRDYMTLAAASKVYHVLKRSGEGMHVSRIREEARRLGWNISEPKIKQVIQFLTSLGMVKAA